MSNADSTVSAVRPCIKCGATERYKNGDCKPCKKLRAVKNQDVARKRSADWYANNTDLAKSLALARRSRAGERDKAARKTAEWRAKDPERARASRVAWAAANPEKVKGWNAAYYAANPDASKRAWQNRRARKQKSGGSLSSALPGKLFKLQKGLCPCCRQPLGDDYHLDHIVPLALGGPNTDDNMQLLRAKCNLQKSKKHPIDFMQSRGFLL